ncbi:MAG: hypothetical protein U9R72_03970 [Chloroflexota bacterium]|nr:hypothetical protein [Chloroflexota bacterium]
MMGFVISLLEPVIAVLLKVLDWFLVVLPRRRLLTFFGVKSSRRIVVYLSNLGVRAGGASGADGRARSYAGSAVPNEEREVADRFRELFARPPGLLRFLGTSSLLDRLFPGSGFRLSDVEVRILSPPSNQQHLDPSASVITLGSPYYNAASNCVESEFNSRARFEGVEIDSLLRAAPPETTKSGDRSDPPQRPSWLEIDSYSGGTIEPIPPSGQPMPEEAELDSVFRWLMDAEMGSASAVQFNQDMDSSERSVESLPVIVVDDEPPIRDTRYSFIERIVDRESGRCIFYAAGLSTLGTIGAAHFLVDRWEELWREHEDEDFVVVLRVDPADPRRSSIQGEY